MRGGDREIGPEVIIFPTLYRYRFVPTSAQRISSFKFQRQLRNKILFGGEQLCAVY
jgi:hypothetical protein